MLAAGLQPLAAQLLACCHASSSSCLLSSSSLWPQLLPALAAAAFHTSAHSAAAATTTSSSSSRIIARKLRQLVAANEQYVPSAFSSGQPLTPSQRESLALLRRFNITQPGLRGQVILARVLRSSPNNRQLLVDPGYYGLNWVPKQELASATAHDAQGNPIPRQSAVINPGEYVKVRLSFFETPYGDAQLEAVSTPHDVRRKLVWEQLVYRMNTGLPVQGRILNATTGGFAVAVAGYVALLPHGQAEGHQAARIGLLQAFTIHSLDHKRRFIKLSGTKGRFPKGSAPMEELYRQTM